MDCADLAYTGIARQAELIATCRLLGYGIST
jgi:hypothetical protein